jgi:predicted RND superfamily exporter protein
MGLTGIPLDVGSAMVAAVVLGIAVDDAIHLLDDFRRRQRSGTRPDLAIEGAVLHVGRALVTTSLALALGFSALALSPWQSVASFGSVSTIAILAALASTLLVLPALVLLAVRLRRPEV